MPSLPRSAGVEVCHDRSEVNRLVEEAGAETTWISFERTYTDALLRSMTDAPAGPRNPQLLVGSKRASLLTLSPPRLESIPSLLGLFGRVVGVISGCRWLPKEELISIIGEEDAADRFIGGSVDAATKRLTLVRGDLKSIVVPFSLFPESGDGTKPDFSQLAFTDYGHTVALGDYESSADAILYIVDPEYRRKLKARRRAEERTFGAALRRLRLQRRLRQSDFAPVSPRTIMRIEAGESGKPHGSTLERIADRLGVAPEEIEEF